MAWYRDFYYTPTRRIRVEGGIKAQSKLIGTRWWAKRWIDVLESFEIGARLSRGKSYARSGQVTAIEIHKGGVTAHVQGSRRTPYSVTIDLAVLTAAKWKTIASALKANTLLASKLLAGEMPEEIEAVFATANIPLFPREHRDLKTDCSCPDWSNPCKHIAAVYFLLGEEFDRDPFMLFRLRGIEREELLGMLGTVSSDPVQASLSGNKGPNVIKRSSIHKSRRSADSTPDADIHPITEKLPKDVLQFWHMGDLSQSSPGEMIIPALSAAVVKRLGPFPFWRGDRTLLETVESLYTGASVAVIETIPGERSQTN
ncbi:MAG TPA: SWIM zinc finger family protein, partial [Bacteroidota bacterium]|nr:SWIM zinc finger family protein [Bacteroidota bacterium]